MEDANSEAASKESVPPQRGGRAWKNRDWTKGSIVGNLMSLGWPMMVGGSLNMMGPTIDMIWVGKLGPSAIAAVGISGMVVMMVNSLAMGMNQGLRAMVARFVGAGDTKMANHVAQQALVINLLYSATMAIIGFFFAEHILILLGVGRDVVKEGAPYLRINFIGMITMSFRMMTESTMQASGDSVIPMRIAFFYRALHIALSPFLIFGWFFFPQMGVTGAAVTNVIAQGLGAVIGMWFLYTGRTRLRLNMKNFHFDPDMVWRQVKVGIPASLTGIQRTFGNLLLVSFMSPFGTLVVAAHSLNQRIEMFLQMPAAGIGQAAGVLAGQNLGAKQPERAQKTGWVAAGLLSAAMIIISTAILIWPEPLIRIFSSDPDLIAVGSTFLRIATANYAVLGLTTVFQQCVNGVGDTMIPMLIMLLNMGLVQIPLAIFLPKIGGLGVYGVRWAIVAGTVTAAIAYTVYFKKGWWKHKMV